MRADPGERLKGRDQADHMVGHGAEVFKEVRKWPNGGVQEGADEKLWQQDAEQQCVLRGPKGPAGKTAEAVVGGGKSQLRSLSSMGGNRGSDPFPQRKNASSVKSKQLGYGEKPDWLTIKATITFLKKEK